MKIQENISLSALTTFKIGGSTRYFANAQSEDELSEALNFARKNKLPVLALGGGSNIAVSDAGFPGFVVKMDMKGVSFEKDGKDILVTAFAGESWDELVAKSVEWGAWGLENLSGIPGSVGASPVQNIGAYGTEVNDSIVSVRAISMKDGSTKIFKNNECRFSYRDSFFKTAQGKDFIITSVTFKLLSEPKPNLSYKDLKEFFKDRMNPSLSEIRDAVLKIRGGKFPDLGKVGTAGSFWKNPIISTEHFARLREKYPDLPNFPGDNGVKIPLAWILDKICGLKGYKIGNVGLWKDQPLVVVATLGATFAELEALANFVAGKVKEATGIEIEREVQYI